MQKHENNSSKDWVSFGCLLQKISNLRKFKLMNYGMEYNIFSKYLEMKKMGVLQIEPINI
jgi:hypothetical protein